MRVEGGGEGGRPPLLPSPQAREAVSRLENKCTCFTGIHSVEFLLSFGREFSDIAEQSAWDDAGRVVIVASENK